MLEQDFIMLILNCKKYYKKAAFQKKTWIPNIPKFLKYYHVIGEESMIEKFKFDDENNILWIKVEDDYNSLPKKIIRAYKAISETFSFKYIYKTDDDQVLTKPQFFDIITNLIKNLSPPPDYGGYIVDIKQPYLSQYNRIHPELPKQLPLYKTKYCSGRFYFLSYAAVINLINKILYIENEYLEDYAIGFHLDNVFKTNIMNLATNLYFTDIELSDFPKWIKEGKI